MECPLLVAYFDEGSVTFTVELPEYTTTTENVFEYIQHFMDKKVVHVVKSDKGEPVTINFGKVNYVRLSQRKPGRIIK